MQEGRKEGRIEGRSDENTRIKHEREKKEKKERERKRKIQYPSFKTSQHFTIGFKTIPHNIQLLDYKSSQYSY